MNRTSNQTNKIEKGERQNNFNNINSEKTVKKTEKEKIKFDKGIEDFAKKAFEKMKEARRKIDEEGRFHRAFDLYKEKEYAECFQNFQNCREYDEEAKESFAELGKKSKGWGRDGHYFCQSKYCKPKEYKICQHAGLEMGCHN